MMTATTLNKPTIDQVWNWLAQVADPEIPVISIVDLGIVRDVHWADADGSEQLVVTITPTYSGCPAVDVITSNIKTALQQNGMGSARLKIALSPPWTTDWISQAGRDRLRAYGIAPPVQHPPSWTPLQFVRRDPVIVACPRCGSTNTATVSQFGSTPCKAQYSCLECREPFDYFKRF
jgi:ring-1,2-phenylacetyl-CoA epoxidase subunit PaaD